MSHLRTRWAALGAAVAVTLGAGGIGITHATLGSGERTAFVPITPCRLADTRPGADNRGPRSTPIGPGQTYTLGAYGAVGDCNLTNLATGLALNVTALNQTQPTFLTIFPSGVARPLTSNLNPAPGQPPTPNAVTVDLNPTGQFDIYNLQGNTDVIVDVVGYYEDHHHDDRYYTKAQVDTKITDSGGDYWGSVSTTGSLYQSSGNVTVTRPAVGEYCIVVPNATAAATSAVVSLNYQAGGAGNHIVTTTLNGSLCNPLVTGGNAVVPVIIQNSAGVEVDSLFNFYIPRK